VSALVLGRTPRRLAELVGTPTLELEATGGPRRSFVVPLRPHGERPPLIVLPPGGGNLVVFDPFVQALDPRVPVLGFDLPGADRDDELPASIDDLCETYLPQIRGVQPHGPYRFLGWSFGGVVAVELATRLAEEGEPVELVAMIDTLVPGLQRAGRTRIYAELLRDLDAAGLLRQVRGTIRVRLLLATAAWRGRRAAARGEVLTPTDRNTWLTIKVDEIVERHRPRPYAGKVLFLAAEDTRPWRTTEPWRRLVPDLEVVVLDGSHDGAEGLLTGERAARVAAEVAARLS
jgi:thioesterase domain-containing protein